MRAVLRSATALLTLLAGAACAAPETQPPAAEKALGGDRPPAAAPVDPLPPTEAATGSVSPERDEWVVMETDEGEFLINLFEERTPAHAENFKKLVRQGWFDGSPFHRVITGFVAQGGGHWVGDTGRTNDVGYEIAPEIRGDLRHVRGAVAAARTHDGLNPGRRSSGSQFYICLRPQPELDLKYTIFGQVISGLDVIDRLKAAPPGKEGLVAPEDASVVRRAWLRPANEPGSAAPDDHSDPAGHSGQH